MVVLMQDDPVVLAHRSLKNTLKVVSGCNMTMLDILNDALDLAELQAGRESFRSVPFSVAEMLDFVVEVHEKGTQIASEELKGKNEKVLKAMAMLTDNMSNQLICEEIVQ